MLVTQKGRLMGVAMLLFPGMLAFCMTSAEFALLQRTSVVTLSICGIFKEVITISAAGIVFHDPLTPINVSGLLVTIASIAAYNFIKITKMRREARERLRAEEPEVEGMLEGVVVTENGVDGEARHVRARRSTSSVLRRESLTLAGPGAEEVNDGERKDRQERLSPTKRPADWE
jgi:solute carrier family 35 protein C2